MFHMYSLHEIKWNGESCIYFSLENLLKSQPEHNYCYILIEHLNKSWDPKQHTEVRTSVYENFHQQII